MAWHRASSPVAAVTAGGAVVVKLGSTTATSGMRAGPFNSIFTWVSSSVITVNMVASEPVPAVVGIATMGTKGPSMTCPKNRRRGVPG